MDNIRAQYGKNAEQLAGLLARAERTGKNANGFTAEQLRERVSEYYRLATATDTELRAHLTRSTR